MEAVTARLAAVQDVPDEPWDGHGSGSDSDDKGPNLDPEDDMGSDDEGDDRRLYAGELPPGARHVHRLMVQLLCWWHELGRGDPAPFAPEAERAFLTLAKDALDGHRKAADGGASAHPPAAAGCPVRRVSGAAPSRSGWCCCRTRCRIRAWTLGSSL